MYKILVIDDQAIVTDSLKYNLEQHEFSVLTAASGEEALQILDAGFPDLIILDVMLTGMDGWHVLEKVRAQSIVPVMMLTALDAETDKVYGLELGADDYIVKPFGIRELLARIRAMLRRRELDAQQAPAQLHIGGVQINLERRQAFLDQHLLDLTMREFDLLATLMTNAGTVLPRNALFDKVWGKDWYGDLRTLDVHIHGLRQKIETATQPYILTVRGVGYRFVAPDEL